MRHNDTYKAVADAFTDWLNDNPNIVGLAIETAVSEYIRNYGLAAITLREDDCINEKE